ncbi:MAG: PAS domain S-box protein [Chloroflexales bacterium]
MIDSPTHETLEQLRAENQRLRARIIALEAHEDEAPLIAGLAPYGPPIWFDAVSDAIFVTDAERQIWDWNRAAEQIYGWPRAEVLGRSITEIIPAARYLDEDAVIAMQHLRQDGVWRGMVVQRDRDGRELVIESATQTLKDDQGALCGYIGVNRDVTAQRRAEQALRERDAQLRLAYDVAQIGTWRRDLTPESRIVQLDARAQIHYGVASADLALDDLLARVHPDDRPQLERVITELPHSDYDSRGLVEYRLTHPDGTTHWLAVHIGTFFVGAGPSRRAVFATGIVQDITAHKQAEAQVRAALAAEQAARQVAEGASERTARLQAITAALAGSLARDHVIAVMTDHGTAATGATDVIVTLVDPDDQRLTCVGWSGHGAEDLAALPALPLSSPRPMSAAVRDRAPNLLTSRDDAEAHFPGFGAILAHYGMHAHATLPLLSADRTLGAMSFSYAQARAFAPEERAFIGALAQQCAQALDRARLYDEMAAARGRLQALSERLIAVQEEERQHLARELHDEIGQSLTGLSLTLTMGSALPPDLLHAQLTKARQQVTSLIAQVRQRSLDLRPAMLDDMGLYAALTWFFERYAEQTGIIVDPRI